MIEINLVPNVKQELLRAQRIRAAVIAGSIITGIVSIVVVAMLSIYVFGVQSVRGMIVDDTIKNGSEKLANVSDLNKILTIQNQLTKISALNDGKKIDSRIFVLLDAINPPAPNNIVVSDLSVDSSNESITIYGQATNSYPAVEIFRKTIGASKLSYKDSDDKQQELVLASEINTSNTSYGEDASGSKVLRFTISFKYIPELFSATVKNPQIVISGDGTSTSTYNVTDSYLGVPKTIFSDAAKDIKAGN